MSADKGMEVAIGVVKIVFFTLTFPFSLIFLLDRKHQRQLAYASPTRKRMHTVGRHAPEPRHYDPSIIAWIVVGSVLVVITIALLGSGQLAANVVVVALLCAAYVAYRKHSG
jgi:hypothetical protein